jgi:UDP-N-acetyl-D-glucosamine dehydrogenase
MKIAKIHLTSLAERYHCAMIRTEKQVVAVIGQGYVGLPLAVACAEAGFNVVGLDKSSDLVSRLNSGKSHIEDIPDNRLMSLIGSGKYRSSTNFSDIAGGMVCIICVPTPLAKDGKPDLSFLEEAVVSIAPYLQDNALLINESTSYPGTLRDVIKPLVEKNRKGGAESIHFASAPERIDPKNEKWDLKSTPRLVSGLDREATDLAKSFYSTISSQVIEVSSPEVAEMAKLLENTFRQVNIALVNQLVPFSRELGIDIREVIKAAGTKPYGFMEFYPGAGVGGHCIPIDPMYLLWKSRQLGIDLPFIENADRVNANMPAYVSKRLIEIIKDDKSKNVLICGVSYKSGVADVRESPAHQVALELEKMGYKVLWSDPLVESFQGFEKYNNQELCGAIIVTAQVGLDQQFIENLKFPVLDCTGVFKSAINAIQL